MEESFKYRVATALPKLDGAHSSAIRRIASHYYPGAPWLDVPVEAAVWTRLIKEDIVRPKLYPGSPVAKDRRYLTPLGWAIAEHLEERERQRNIE